MNLVALPLGLRVLRRFPLPRKLGVLERLYGKRLKNLGCQWVECWNGVHWKLDLSDPCHRWIVYGYYEGGEGIEFALDELANGGVCIDSGANIGQWLLYYAANPHIQTFAVEPVASEYAWLCECITKQQNWNVTVSKIGFGATASNAKIRAYGARSTLHLDWYKSQTDLATEEIRLVTLDDFIQQHGIQQVSFWKLDVEGAELSAIQGAELALKQNSIKNIYVECHPDSFLELKQLLSAHSYKLFQLINRRLVPYGKDSIDETTDLVARPIDAV